MTAETPIIFNVKQAREYFSNPDNIASFKRQEMGELMFSRWEHLNGGPFIVKQTSETSALPMPQTTVNNEPGRDISAPALDANRGLDPFAELIAEEQRAAKEIQAASVPAPMEPIAEQESNFRKRARMLAERSIPVALVLPGKKNAFEKDWQNSATTDPTILDERGRVHPEANTAAVAQAKIGGYWFLEIDSADVLKRIEAETGKTLDPMSTFSVRSRPGRGHFYFKQTPASIAMGNLSQSYVKNSDWSARVNSEYVVGPGSYREDTKTFYEIVSDADIIEAPDWLVEWCVSQKIQKQKNAAEDIPRDERGLIQNGNGRVHGFMLHHAGRLRQMGLDEDAIKAGLYDLVKKNCAGPIDWKKVDAMARSVCSYPAGQNTDIVLTQTAPEPLTVPEGVVPIAEEMETEPIPPFDPSVVNGIYKKFVDVATRGTTMAPQFVYAIAKTVVGARMAGKVKFENLDVEPRFYTALIGETGSGKGEAWRRVFQILNCEGQIGNVAGLKIINSADSGAGIRDAFFEPPESAPMLMYVDEVEGFGNKAAATRNPAILDSLIELADSTSISRVKAAKKDKASKTKNDARLCAVMCGQEGSVYMKAFAGRTKLGVWDRLSPEYGVAVEAGDLPHISTPDAFQLLGELNKLDYSGVMSMSDHAKTRLEAFWSEQAATVRRKARWKKNLTLDAYMSAFGRGSKVAELEDVEIAVKIFTRQLVIRQTHFTTEVPDRTGYYLGLVKSITEKMQRRLAAGLPEWQVARSRRDYEKETHAHRDNETHIFERAWAVHAPTWLRKVEIKKANGQTYIKYLPALEDD